MKLIRWKKGQRTLPGIILEGQFCDLSSFGEDFNETFFETGGLDRLVSFLANHPGKLPTLHTPIQLASPVARPSKLVCIGLNYVDHARETKAQPPVEPVIFLKATTALCGPFDPIIIPKNSKKTDWEVELAVVNAKRGHPMSRSKEPWNMSPAIACTTM